MTHNEAQNTKSSAGIKGKRAQLKHLLLNVHFFNLPKIRALGKRFDSAGKLSLVEAYCQMSCATDATISEDALLCVLEDNGVSDPQAFIAYSLEHGLITKESKGYSNSEVIKDQESYANKLEKDRNRKGKEKIPTGIRSRASVIPSDPDIDTDSDSDLDIDLKEKGELSEWVETPNGSKFWDIAAAALVPPDDPSLQSDNQFIVCGRRPMRKYPLIRLSTPKLCEILEDYEAAGIPMDSERKVYGLAFRKVQSRMEMRQSKNQSLDGVDCYVWLTGWAKQELLDDLSKQNRLKREEKYLEKAYS